MSSTATHYCVICGTDREFRYQRQPTEFDVRGETLVVDVPVKVCVTCKTIEAEEGVDPVEVAFSQYRERKGLLAPPEIRRIREQYRLSQRSFASLLGMSEATINRYEGGGLQTEAHDHAIRACENATVMRDLLRRHGDRLSAWQRQRVEEALRGDPEARRGILLDASKIWDMPSELSLTTGFRRFDYTRYAAVVVWLCRQLPLVTATSLNKLLFYVDFLLFRSESVSFTGAAYRRLPYGPVPADFGRLRVQMEIDQYVEIREVNYQNGSVGEEYRLGPKADELAVPFSDREMKVLMVVAEVFENLTPGEISDRSHQESAYRDTPDRELISYQKAHSLSLPVPD